MTASEALRHSRIPLNHGSGAIPAVGFGTLIPAPVETKQAVTTALEERMHMSPAQVALSWAAQRGTAFLTTSTKPQRIQENYQLSVLPEDAMRDIRERITTNIRFNSVVQTGVPGFIPRSTG